MIAWVAETIALPILALAVALAAFRLLRGPGVPDRIVAVDLLGTIAIGIAACAAVAYGQQAFIDAAMIIALLSFLGTVAFAGFLGRRKTS